MPFFILLFASFLSLAHAVESATPALAPSTKDKKNSYSIRTQTQECTAEHSEKCEISTFVVSKELASDFLIWERRIYFQHYDPAKPVDSQTITVKSLSLVRGKVLVVKNSRGDSFELAVDHGHLKKPKDARDYSK
jgi:hypothetical protein